MAQAVVKIGKSQYLVQPGMELLVDRQAESKDKVSFGDVYLIFDENQTLVGQPTVPGAVIKAKVLGEEKGEKIRVAKFKAKSRYRKVTGFRPIYTKILIEDIVTGINAELPPKISKPRKITKTKASEN